MAVETGSDTEVGRRWAALLVACAAAFLTPFMAAAVNVALPSIGREFRLDAVSLGWVMMAYSLAAAMFLLPFGRLADIYGRKRVLVAGLLLDATASLLACFVTRSAPVLIALRALQGIGGAMIFGTGLAILTSVYPATERGRVLGINVAAVYSGLTLGPFIGGLLTAHLGWRSLFVLNAGIAVTAAVLALVKLIGEWREAQGERFDLIGSLLYGPAVVALMYGFSKLPGFGALLSTGGGLVGLVAFVVWESRQAAPLIDVNLFRRNRVFAMSNLAALISYTSAGGAIFLLSLYLQHVKSLTPDRAGTVLLAAPLMQAIFSPLAGRFSDRVEPRVVASTGMALTALALGMLTVLGVATHLLFVIGSLVVFGLGFALFSSPNTNAVMGSVEQRMYGVASGTVGTMRLTGQMLSLGFVMLVLSLHMGRAEIAPATYGAFLSGARVAFGLFAVLCTGGVFASLARGRVR